MSLGIIDKTFDIIVSKYNIDIANRFISNINRLKFNQYSPSLKYSIKSQIVFLNLFWSELIKEHSTIGIVILPQENVQYPSINKYIEELSSDFLEKLYNLGAL